MIDTSSKKRLFERFQLTTLSIRSLLLLITCVVALPSIAIIIYSGIQFRNDKIDDALAESFRLTERIVSEQQSLVVGAEQLMAALAILPEVRNRETAKVEPILRELKKLNCMYSNIFIADHEGTVWATAVPVKPPFVVADRRYFKNALESGQLSSGEYIVSRANTRQIISLSYPIKDHDGKAVGVISIGILLDEYSKLLERMELPTGTSFLLIDHRGIVLFRAINPEPYVGKPYPTVNFSNMQAGPDTMTTVRNGIAGDKRIITYRKLRLPGEKTPYMYVSSGIPYDAVTRVANRALLLNIASFMSLLLLTFMVALLIGKRAVADRIRLLEKASQQVAAGDLQIRVASLVRGGELGNLGQMFDTMTEKLTSREAERLKAERERLNLERQLQHAQKLESLGVLAGGIAHDFNNILAVIIGHCGLAVCHPEKAADHIQPIQTAAERAAGLCRQMLAYAGKAPAVVTRIDMKMLVAEMIRMLKATIPQNAVITPEYRADIPFIEADDSQIRQVVMNLIINAAEAIGEAHGEIRVSLTNSEIREGDSDKDHLGNIIPPEIYLCLEVTDNGCGMDDETMFRIFEPFYTTKFTGRGLGMSATLGIITAHNGALQLLSLQGQGTTFKVYLPVHKDVPAISVAEQEGSAAQWQGSGTILLVEDEEQIKPIAVTFLEMLGFTVIEAANGREALALYQKNAAAITMVVTDMGMPVMDGYELVRELKNLNPTLPIIISSGFGDAEVASRIASTDIAGIISKPYNFDQLRELMKSVADADGRRRLASGGI